MAETSTHKPHVLGVDVGTQGTKVVLFSANGQARASSFQPSRLHQPAPGVVEEDPEFQLETVCRGIAECMEKSSVAPASVAALALDGQMAGVIGVGADGVAVTPYDSWLDTRCAPQIKTMREQAGDEIIRKTGGPPSFNHGPKILWWRQERPEIFKRIAAFVQPGGYAAMRLCGLKADEAFIDTTYLHFSGFADTRNASWDAGLCRTFGLESSKLPRIVAPQTRIGALTTSAAQRCGLLASTPVIAGCGDTAASFLATGATRAGVCVDVAGSASVFAATTAAFRPDTRFRTLGWGRSATPGLWHPYAYINGGGLNLEWFRTALAGRPDSNEAFSLSDLDQRAAALPPEDELPFFVPHLSGRVSPSQPHLRGAWVGITREHSLAHLYRSVLEGVALEYGIYASILRELNPELPLSELRVTGGGEKSALWNQLKADMLGARVICVRSRTSAEIAGSEGAPRGAAMLAALGVGLIQDLNEASATWVATGAVTEPRCATGNSRAARETRLARYKSLLEMLNQWSTDERR